MDNFDEKTYKALINKFKSNTISKLESMNLSQRDLCNHADLLCFVPEYSPILSDKLTNKSNKTSF